MASQQFQPTLINRFIAGLQTQGRSPLVTPYTVVGINAIPRNDALITGSNMELTVNQTIARSPGFPTFCPFSFGANEWPLGFYSWRKNDGTINPLVDTQTAIYAFNSNYLNPIFTKSAGAGQTQFQNVGDVLYFVNGVDAKKWDGSLNLISQSQTFNAAAWTSTATVTANFATAPDGTVTADKLNDTSASVFQSSAQSIAVAANTTTYVTSIYVQKTTGVTNTFGFNVAFSGGTVTSATPRLNTNTGVGLNFAGSSGLGTGGVIDAGTYWRLWIAYPNNGTNTSLTISVQPATGTNSGNNPGADSASTTGSAVVWGAQVEIGNGPSPYTTVVAQPQGGHITNIGIIAPSTAPTLSTTVGTLSPTVGFFYVYTFLNSSTGTESTASPLSALIKPSAQNVVVQGSRSTDPQCDKINIYRTTDGGSEFTSAGNSAMFFVAQVANPGSGTWSFTDNTLDQALDTELTAPLDDENDPPSAGMNNLVFYQGRMWGSVDNLLFFTGGGDVLTGVPEEAWPPANVFTLPGKITALMPTVNGLMVFCSDSINVVLGGPTTTSYFVQPWMNNLGVLTQNAVSTDTESLFMYSPSRQMQSIDGSSAITPIGLNVGDVFNANFDPAKIYLAAHRSGIDWGLFASDGSANIFRYSLLNQSWSPLRTVVGGVGAIASLETSPGVYTLVAGRSTGSGNILARNLTSFVDGASSTYACSMTIGSLSLSAPGTPASQLFPLDYIVTDRMPVGSEATVKILANDISGTFTNIPISISDPDRLPASTGVISRRWQVSTGTVSQHIRHMQIQISFPSEAAKNEILIVTIQPKNDQ